MAVLIIATVGIKGMSKRWSQRFLQPTLPIDSPAVHNNNCRGRGRVSSTLDCQSTKRQKILHKQLRRKIVSTKTKKCSLLLLLESVTWVSVLCYNNTQRQHGVLEATFYRKWWSTWWFFSHSNNANQNHTCKKRSVKNKKNVKNVEKRWRKVGPKMFNLLPIRWIML